MLCITQHVGFDIEYLCLFMAFDIETDVSSDTDPNRTRTSMDIPDIARISHGHGLKDVLRMYFGQKMKQKEILQDISVIYYEYPAQYFQDILEVSGIYYVYPSVVLGMYD